MILKENENCYNHYKKLDFCTELTQVKTISIILNDEIDIANNCSNQNNINHRVCSKTKKSFTSNKRQKSNQEEYDSTEVLNFMR